MTKQDDNLVRLQKAIADAGVASRRHAEQLILDGRVSVNDEVVTTLGTKVNPNKDVIQVDGSSILVRDDKIYIVLHKPRGYITTVSDPKGRDTVMDLVKEIPQRIYPVGRLDYLSEGLLIMTNDGDIANKIMHPKYEVLKVYEVKVFGIVSEQILKKLRNGIKNEDGILKPKSVRVIEQLQNKTWLEFILAEGKNREIRKICEGHGLTIDKLKRVSIEALTIHGIAPGKWRMLSKKELLKALNMNEDGSKKFKDSMTIRSAKKTIDVSKKRRDRTDTSMKADDPKFQQYRKDKYFDTMKKKKFKSMGAKTISNDRKK